MEKCIEWIKDNHIINLIVGFIFSVFSIGRYNIVISIYIWPFCFLNYLHRNEKKVIPLVVVSLCLLFANMIRWIGYSNVNIGIDFIVGAYYFIIKYFCFPFISSYL